jgi:hypothetical protein
MLKPGGIFISFDPNRFRFVGMGKILVRSLLQKYHSPDERELHPREMADEFKQAGFVEAVVWPIDFFVNVLCWIFPNLPIRLAEVLAVVDDLMLKTPGLNQLSSGFSVVARTEG